jgi:hypothetical protein
MNVALVLLSIPVVVAAVVLILVAGRREPDPDRRRTEARYLGAVCFLAVFVTLFGAYGVVAQLSTFVIDRGDDREFSFDDADDIAPLPLPGGGGRPSDDAIWRGAVQAALLTAAAAAVLVFHRRRRRVLRATPEFGDSTAARADTAYLYAACFVAAFLILFCAAFGVYGLFRIVAPGVTGFDNDLERQRGIAQAVSLAALGVGALLVFRVHWRERPGAPAAPAVPPEPVAPDPVPMA